MCLLGVIVVLGHVHVQYTTWTRMRVVKKKRKVEGSIDGTLTRSPRRDGGGCQVGAEFLSME